LAVQVYALTSLLQDLEEDEAGLLNVGLNLDHISIGCDGSVINKYPRYMERAQEILDRLRGMDRKARQRVVLRPTTDNAVFGAAVAGCLAAKAS